MVSKELIKEFPILKKMEEIHGDLGSVKVQKVGPKEAKLLMEQEMPDMVSKVSYFAEQGVVFFYEYNDKIAIRHVWCVIVKTSERISYENVGSIHELTLGYGCYANDIARFISDKLHSYDKNIPTLIDSIIVDSMKPSTIAMMLNNNADRISALCYQEFTISFIGDDKYGSIIMKLVRNHLQH